MIDKKKRNLPNWFEEERKIFLAFDKKTSSQNSFDKDESFQRRILLKEIRRRETALKDF